MAWIVLVGLSLSIWLFLLNFWGNFWRADRYVEDRVLKLDSYPTVWAIIPARDEAEVIEQSLISLLSQQYSGHFFAALVDDNSSDRTSEIARAPATIIIY